ncbi:MAG: peptidoglycan-binding protein [Ilumatobacter sp.]|nr:peptidoglycan-binding protein [Ilumatobacter sp.]
MTSTRLDHERGREQEWNMRAAIRRPKLARATAALTVVALVASACSGADDEDDEPSDESVVDDGADEGTGDDADETPSLDGEGLSIGFIQPEVGLFNLLGAAQAGGLALAAQDIAAGGGVLGGELTVVTDQPTPERDVTSVFETLLDDTSRLIVGPATSDEARQIIPMLGSSDAVLCGASTTAPGLTTLEGADGRFIRTTFDDNVVAVHTFDRIREYTAGVIGRPPVVTIVSRGDAYGDGLSNTLAGLLGLVGMQVTVQRYNPEDVLMEGVGEAAAATGADLYVMIGLDEGARLAGVLREAGVEPSSMLGLDGLATPRLGEKAIPDDPTALDGAAAIGSTGPISFLTRLVAEQESQGEVLYGAQAYDCAISYALAVEAAGSADPAEVAVTLRTVTGGGGVVCTTYATCRGLLAEGEDIDYNGPSGPIEIDEDGEPGGGRFLTARVRGGTLTIVADLSISLDELRDRVAPQIAGFIADVQVALTQLGYYTGPIDGQDSDEFRAAVSAFQADNGLDPTGELDAATIAALQAALGDNSILTSTIIEVQQLLTELGYYTGPIDGTWSDELSDAIMAFQTDLGVEPTGILDAATLRAIYQAGVTTGENNPPETTTTTIGTATTFPVESTTTLAPTTTVAPTTPTTTAPTTTTTVPANSALGVLKTMPQFSRLVALLNPAVVAAIPELTDPEAEITFFAPNDTALAALTGTPTDAQVVAIVQGHIIGEAIDPLADGTYDSLLVATRPGATIGIDASVTPATITNFDGSVPANALGSAMPTAGGFVWEIDRVLTPPAS